MGLYGNDTNGWYANDINGWYVNGINGWIYLFVMVLKLRKNLCIYIGIEIESEFM